MASPIPSDGNSSFEDAAEGNQHYEDDADRTVEPESAPSVQSSSASKSAMTSGEAQQNVRTVANGSQDRQVSSATNAKALNLSRGAGNGGFAALKARFEKEPQSNTGLLTESNAAQTHIATKGTTLTSSDNPNDLEDENQDQDENRTPPIPPSEGAQSLLDPLETIANPFAATMTPTESDPTYPNSPHLDRNRLSTSSRLQAENDDPTHVVTNTTAVPDTPSRTNRFSIVSLGTTLPSSPGSSKRSTGASAVENTSLPDFAGTNTSGSSEFLLRNTARLSTMIDSQNHRSIDSNTEHFKEKLNELRYTHSRESSVAGKTEGAGKHEDEADDTKIEASRHSDILLDDEKHLSAQSSKTTTHPAELAAERRPSWDGPPADELEDEHIDWDFWGDVMSNYQQIARTQPRQLSRAIQAGIPAALRGMMWQLMSSSKDEEMEIIYAYYLKQTSPHEKMIRKDLARTFPGQDYFRDGKGIGQENLFNVVKAYSLYDEECGYCQGMQFVVGPLLLNMPDEEAFSTLVRLMKSYDLRGHFVPNMPALQLRLFQFERLLEEFLPLLHRHLVRQGIKSSMYASGWIMTLFTYRSPLAICFRILDSVFAEGIEAVFRFALALMLKNEEQLLSMSFDEAVPLLAGRIFEVYKRADEPLADGLQTPNPSRISGGHDDDGHRASSGDKTLTSLDDCTYRVSEFVRDAFQFKITPFMLDSYASDFAEQVKVATAHRREMDALKMDNRALQLRVKNLEDQLGAVQEEHVDLVKSVVMAKLAREEMAEELMRYKMMYAEAALLVDQSGAGQQQQAMISPSSSGSPSIRQSQQ